MISVDYGKALNRRKNRVGGEILVSTVILVIPGENWCMNVVLYDI